ncbi:ly-6/neurotoxin-like protein 1 [Talpa occidentalis]|uniref:ly-6/neurotoxin-like protein 1 n=1 Tax=Talpa occidentalis TaxID=50954 RepID=UPI00188E9840|nr:ly-6/neurotoxin-like protein 1 [Talpa occidentalis]
MGTRLLLLLLLLLPPRPAQALSCHQCTSAQGTCLRPTSCDTGARYCLTTWNTPPGQGTKVIKSCAYRCPGIQESLPFSWASCCNADLCNRAGTRGPATRCRCCSA